MKLTRYPYAALAVLLLLTSAGSGFSQIKLVEQTTGEAALQVIGNVKTVLDGVSTGTAFHQIQADNFLAALGCASVYDDATSQGETLFLGGEAFVKSVDSSTSYATEKRRGNCWGSFVAGLTSSSLPVARYRIETTEPVTLDALYRKIHEHHGFLVGVLGVANFSKLELSTVRKAPVYGEPILGPRKADYFHPVQSLQDTKAVFFGFSLRSNAEATDATRKVFYVNPDDRLSTAGQSHTHCGMFSPQTSIEGLEPTSAAPMIDAVAHVLTQSSLSNGEFLVFEPKRED